MNYNVIYNLAGSIHPAMLADYIIAFCGSKMYIVKNRYHDPDPMPPCKPDCVIAYYQRPEPHVAVLPLRDKS